MATDGRAAKAREHHRLSGQAAADGRQHRTARNQLVRQLHADGGWTHQRLATAVGCSPKLIAAILSGRVD